MAKIAVNAEVKSSLVSIANDIQAKRGFAWAVGSYQIQSAATEGSDRKGKPTKFVEITNLDTDVATTVDINQISPFVLDDNSQPLPVLVDGKPANMPELMAALVDGVKVEIGAEGYRFNGAADETLQAKNAIKWNNKLYPRMECHTVTFTRL